MAVVPGTCASEGGLSGPALFFLGLAAVVVAGCSGSIQKVVRAPKDKLALTTAFVYPFGFKWQEPVYRRFELSQRLIEVAIAKGGERFGFYGPSEFRLLKENDDAAWVASTALTLLTTNAQRAEQGVIIRPWAERRINSSIREGFDKQGKSTGMASMEETTYFGHVEVVHPSSNTVLVEVTGEVLVNPFDEPTPEDEFDPARKLTVLMSKLVAEALKLLAPFAAARQPGPELGLTLALTPKATARYDEPNRAPLDTELLSMDPVAAEVLVQARAKFLAPALPDAALGRVVKLPAGLFVVAAPEGAKVKPGDLLLAIDGEDALPQRLARQRFSGGVPAQVRVRRSTGEETEVMLP